MAQVTALDAASTTNRAAGPLAAPRNPNLVTDTLWRRTRAAVLRAVHAMDDAIASVSNERAQVLFEATSPISVAVFRPVLERLQRDPRVDLWFTTSDTVWQPDQTFVEPALRRHVIPVDKARWMKFDCYLNTDFWNMTWLPRRTRRLHMFHGVAGKYGLDAPARIAPTVAAFDRLLFPNRDRLLRYAQAGLVDADSPTAALVGYPKVDCLVDGSLDRDAILREIGLDPDWPTVLYAPTWSPYSSLNAAGRDIVRALSRLDVNLIVKLHDRSLGGTTRGSGGVNWTHELAQLCDGRRVHLARQPDASPYLFAADLLVTDHSSVGFEFMLLDRPIVVIDCPALVEKARINPQKVELLRGAADVVARAEEVAAAVRRGFHDPAARGAARRAVARELFYSPGTATNRATDCVYDMLGLTSTWTETCSSTGERR